MQEGTHQGSGKNWKWSGTAFNMNIIKLFLCYTEYPCKAPNSPLVEKQLAIYAEFWQNQKGGMHSAFKKKKQRVFMVSSGITPSVQFSRSVVSDSLRPHDSQHARPPCPSPTPGFSLNSCPFSRWCHPAISSSVIPFSSWPRSLPASRSFPMSQFFAWGGQSIGASAPASVPPMNTQDWSPLEWTGWISLQSKGLSRVFSNTTV